MSISFRVNSNTGAYSETVGMEFNSADFYDDSRYAGGFNGLVKLHGDTDDGQDIECKITTRKTDLGIPQKKRLRRGYIQYITTGKVIVNAQGIITILSDSSSFAQKIFPGNRGVASDLWEFTVSNVNGSDLILKSLSGLFIPLTRHRDIGV